MEPKIKEKRWSKELEREVYESWKKSKAYRFNEKTRKPVYSIDTPPPYVNSPIHIGHATTYVLMDMFARFRRMKGSEVLFPLGLDRNGLPIEIAAERKLNKASHEMPREEFLEACKKVLEEASTESTNSFLKLGISFNSWETGTGIGDLYLTDSDDYRTLTQETFIDLWNKGLIYEDKRLNNFDPKLRTTISDSEVVRKEKETFLNYVAFKEKKTGEELIIATTRPELLCTAAIILFNPEDERYKHLQGKKALVPVYNFEVPIIAHPMAQPEFGSGLVFMSRSAGDTDAIRFLIEMNIEAQSCMNEEGKMTEVSGFLKGLKSKEAREKIIEKMKQEGTLKKQEKILHSVPVSERSGAEIEFISMPEFYLKQLDFKEKMLEISKELNFFSESSRQILIDWINNIKIDWPISRRRYYATEIPLWYCKKCSYIFVPKKGKYFKPWKEQPSIKACPECKGTEWIGEERVFDTWFDSSISPLYILKYSRNEKFFEKNSPCSLRPKGKEIIRTWLYYTLLKDYLLTGKTIFKDVWINYHIVDDQGKKMSKSIGNVIDPQKILEKHGAEPFRLWAAIEGNLDSQDFRCSDERIQGAGKTITKLWNAAKFISMFNLNEEAEILDQDKWILSELNSLIKEAEEKFMEYDFHSPALMIRQFIWDSLASNYIELVKTRAYNQEKKYSIQEQESAVKTLFICLENLLKLLSPINPMITEKLFKDIYGREMHSESFPKEIDLKKFKSDFSLQELIELNSSIWKAKKDAGLALNQEIKELIVPKKFKAIEADLTAAHKAAKLSFGELKTIL